MSFCPTKDIHSVYLDNELPDSYKADYEKHISECPKCRAELAKLKAVRNLFKDDVIAVTPDEHFMDDSYQRLLIKMSYNKNSKKTRKHPFFNVGYVVSAAAAALLVAVVMPIGMSKSAKTTTAAETSSEEVVTTPNLFAPMLTMPQFGNNISFGSGNTRAISGNMDILSSNSYFGNFNSSGLNFYTGLPQFTGDNAISIRVTIPNVGYMPMGIYDYGIYNAENEEQEESVLSGNYLWNFLEN